MTGEPVFVTERLTIRPWTSADAPCVLAIYADPEVARWTSTPDPMQTLDEARSRIEGWAQQADPARGFGIWAVVAHEPDAPDGPVGIVLLRPLARSDEVEIGWTLHPAVHGRGYATEAASGALAHARDHGHRRVRAIMWPDNTPSRAVAERLGMTDLGDVEDPWYGTPQDPTSLMCVLDL